MEIEIRTKPIAKARTDLVMFRKLLAKDWSLEKAVRKSSEIIDCPDEMRKQFMQLIWLGLDWKGIINQFGVIKDTEMKIKLYKVKYKDWVKYEPGWISSDATKFKLKEKRESGEDVIMIQSFIKQPSFTIKNFIDNEQFTYPENKWGVEVELE